MNPAHLPTTQSPLPRAAEEDLVRRVRQFLRSQLPALSRRIEVAAAGDTVTVEGTLRSFYDRQLAIACIRRVAGVRHVVDLVTVVESPGRSHKPQEVLV